MFQEKLNHLLRKNSCVRKYFPWLLAAVLSLAVGCQRKSELLLLEDTGETDMATGETSDAGEDYIPEKSQDEESVAAKGESQEAAGEGKNEDSREAPAEIWLVHICGAVNSPGVYELAAGSRLYQAVEAAGGFSTEADADYLNQAGLLADGVQLVIPTKEETQAIRDGEAEASAFQIGQEGSIQIGTYSSVGTESFVGTSSSVGTGDGTGASGGLVNINTASLTELCTLPGIGTGKAQSILDYREANGKFSKPEDIMKVEGIKEGLFAKIRDFITL